MSDFDYVQNLTTCGNFPKSQKLAMSINLTKSKILTVSKNLAKFRNFTTLSKFLKVTLTKGLTKSQNRLIFQHLEISSRENNISNYL